MERAWEGGDLEDAWGGLDGLEAAWSMGGDLMGRDNCLGKAQQLLREGKDLEAVLALEAEVQQNPQSSEGWRLLGEVHASFDNDQRAIACLTRGTRRTPTTWSLCSRS